MRRLAAVLTFAMLIPSMAHAQATVEIGTGIGAAISFAGRGGAVTQIGVPGPGAGAFGLAGQAPIYASFFVGEGVMLQPEVAFSLVTGGDETITTLISGLQLGYAFMGASQPSPYAAVNGAFQWTDHGGDGVTAFAVGARVGYRFLVNQGFATSFEAGYRRWLKYDGWNEVTVGIRLGGILSSPK